MVVSIPLRAGEVIGRNGRDARPRVVRVLMRPRRNEMGKMWKVGFARFICVVAAATRDDAIEIACAKIMYVERADVIFAQEVRDGFLVL